MEKRMKRPWWALDAALFCWARTNLPCIVCTLHLKTNYRKSEFIVKLLPVPRPVKFQAEVAWKSTVCLQFSILINSAIGCFTECRCICRSWNIGILTAVPQPVYLSMLSLTALHICTGPQVQSLTWPNLTPMTCMRSPGLSMRIGVSNWSNILLAPEAIDYLLCFCHSEICTQAHIQQTYGINGAFIHGVVE